MHTKNHRYTVLFLTIVAITASVLCVDLALAVNDLENDKANLVDEVEMLRQDLGISTELFNKQAAMYRRHKK